MRETASTPVLVVFLPEQRAARTTSTDKRYSGIGGRKRRALGDLSRAVAAYQRAAYTTAHTSGTAPDARPSATACALLPGGCPAPSLCARVAECVLARRD